MNSETGANSLVFLLTMKPMPTPQSGWQPQLSEPQSAPGPFSRSVTRDIELEADSGNQSRSGSVTPVWRFMSSARCESVYRLAWRSASVMSSSRPVKDTGWNDTKLILSQLASANLTIGPDLIVVDRVDDRDDEADVDAGRVQVLDRAQLHVEEIADLAVRVGRVAHAVELQVGDPHAGGLARPSRTPGPARTGCRWSPPAR